MLAVVTELIVSGSIKCAKIHYASLLIQYTSYGLRKKEILLLATSSHTPRFAVKFQDYYTSHFPGLLPVFLQDRYLLRDFPDL